MHAKHDIVWKHIESGIYTAKSTYLAPPKVKFFAWLAMQNRVWSADHLANRGWPNCGFCLLCKRVQESIGHLLFRCRYTTRLWEMIKDWLQLESINTSTWHLARSTKEWWIGLSDSTIPNRKAMATLSMLTSWTIWNERNARIFQLKSAPPTVLLANIKIEAQTWVTPGAKK